NGDVYFEVSKDVQYGKLSNRTVENMQGEGGGMAARKRSPGDFALWKSAKPGEPSWDSSWGPGRPGWHIECSAMSMKYLGETFDIHCGGNDHIPVHHTNEIAQSECATGKQFVKYWMHTAFLILASGKMSKSKGGFLTVQTLTDSGYDPLAYRFLCLQAHYRSELTLAWEWDDDKPGTGRAESLDAAKTALTRLYEKIARTTDEPLHATDAYETAYAEVLAALNDDLNVPKALATLQTYASPRLWKAFDVVLGLDIERRAVPPAEEIAPSEVLALLEARQTARKAKNFAESDALRDRIAALGYEVADTPGGATVKRKA
ncbi:MAG: cysteine--tRNA ligase, partial [Armatimonadetes bacterium]|nr:cysteine--tRNA ligase [Armatimonadota bacterium]